MQPESWHRRFAECLALVPGGSAGWAIDYERRDPLCRGITFGATMGIVSIMIRSRDAEASRRRPNADS